MADTKISALPAATTPLAGTEVLPVVQGGTTDQVSVANLTAGRAVSAASYTPTGTAIPTNGIYAPATNNIGFANAGVSTFRTTADNTFQIGSTTSATAKVFVYANNSVAGADVNAAVYIRQDGTNHIQTWAGSGGNIRGYMTSGGTLVMDDDNIQFSTAAKGVNFTANTPAAGMTSQLLNNYEEGTCSFTVTSTGGTITTASASAVYTRVGRLVTITGTVTVTTNGTGTGSLLVAGLPFTPSTAACGVGRESVNNGKTASFMISAASTTMSVQAYDNTYPVSSGSVIQFSASYTV